MTSLSESLSLKKGRGSLSLGSYYKSTLGKKKGADDNIVYISPPVWGGEKKKGQYGSGSPYHNRC